MNKKQKVESGKWKVDFGKWIKNLFVLHFLFSIFCFPIYAYAEVAEGIVAIVNDEVITRYDLEQYLAPLYFQYKAEYQGQELQEKLKQLQQDGLRRLIEEKLLLSQAKKLKITVDSKEVGARLAEVKARFESEEVFYQALDDQGVSEEELEDRYRDQFMIQRLVDEQVRYWVNVSPAEVRAYYDSHEEEFNMAERIKLRNILIRAETEEKEEEAFIRAHELLVMLHNGSSFEELAKQYSEGPHASDGGLMGLVAKGELAGEFEDEVFALETGGVSNVIKSSLGYHIFKAEEKILAQMKPFNEAQKEIQERLLREKTETRYQSFIGELRSKAYISVK